MLKKLLIAILLSIPVIIFGQSIEDFSYAVDFTISLGELQDAAATGDPNTLPSRFVIIEGAVASRVVVNSDRNDYVGEIELVGGEWVGVESVVRYRCFLLLVGPEFASAIPVRRSRTPNPAEIALNSRILVIAKAIGLRPMEDGTHVPVLQVYAVRKIT